MKTIDEIKHAYESDFQESVQQIEKKRKVILRKFFLNVLAVIGLLAFNSFYFDEAKYFVGIFILFFGFIFVRKRYFILKAEFAMEFKENIVAGLITLIDDRLNYFPGYGISEETFIASGITNESVDRYYSEDFFEGVIDGVSICFAEVIAESEQRTENGTSYTDIFRGILFRSEFNKNFTSRTTISPNIFNGRMRRIAEFFAKQSIAPEKSKKVNLEDPEFNKYFIVYGQDQIEARYILSTSLMSRILEFRKKHRSFSMSFSDNNMYMGLFSNANLFEPRIFRPVVNLKILENYIDTIQLVIGIVGDLKTNNKL